MTLFLLYDKQGNITSGAVVAPEFSDQLELVPGPEERVLKTTLQEIGASDDMAFAAEGRMAEDSIGTIRDAAMRFRVDVGRDRLVKLPGS
jgi:hypothetical protein